MWIPAPVSAGVVLSLMVSSAPAAVLDVPPMPLVIRLYETRSVPDTIGRSAVQEASRILAEAGFVPEWLACTAPPATTARCSVPLAAGELAVRIVTTPHDRPASQSSASAPPPRIVPALPLGYALIDRRTKAGSLATIYFDRVAWLAAAAGSDVAALLGRTIAHEIGHLLLGTNRHTPLGIMRAVWSREDVSTMHPDDWRFLAGDAERMRAALTRRTKSRAHVVWGD